jgi:hypothetical protein
MRVWTYRVEDSLSEELRSKIPILIMYVYNNKSDVREKKITQQRIWHLWAMAVGSGKSLGNIIMSFTFHMYVVLVQQSHTTDSGGGSPPPLLG